MRWTAGLDPAFHADRFGVALVGQSDEQPGVVLVGSVEALAPKGKRAGEGLLGRRTREDATLDAVWEILRPYHAPEHGRTVRIVSDQHQGDAIQAYFQALGVAVKIEPFTPATQTAAFTSTRARLVDRSLRAWKAPQLLEDLRRLRVGDTVEKVELPRYAGGHCDTASALALAVYELRAVRLGSGAGLRRTRTESRPAWWLDALEPAEQARVAGPHFGPDDSPERRREIRRAWSRHHGGSRWHRGGS